MKPLLIGMTAAITLTACTTSTLSPSDGFNLSSLSGTWRSAAASTSDMCNTIRYTVTPTDATTATITYSATCVGVPITGTGNGALSGTTLDWSTSGLAGTCSYSLSGTATPAEDRDLNVVYGGKVCGVPVSGSQVLHR